MGAYLNNPLCIMGPRAGVSSGMDGMPFVCESVVPHLSATLSERCTGERRALFNPPVQPAVFVLVGKVVEPNDIQDCTGKEFLKKNKLPSLKL